MSSTKFLFAVLVLTVGLSNSWATRGERPGPALSSSLTGLATLTIDTSALLHKLNKAIEDENEIQIGFLVGRIESRLNSITIDPKKLKKLRQALLEFSGMVGGTNQRNAGNITFLLRTLEDIESLLQEAFRQTQPSGYELAGFEFFGRDGKLPLQGFAQVTDSQED